MGSKKLKHSFHATCVKNNLSLTLFARWVAKRLSHCFHATCVKNNVSLTLFARWVAKKNKSLFSRYLREKQFKPHAVCAMGNKRTVIGFTLLA